jgi:hypothetical protein
VVGLGFTDLGVVGLGSWVLGLPSWVLGLPISAWVGHGGLGVIASGLRSSVLGLGFADLGMGWPWWPGCCSFLVVRMRGLGVVEFSI